MNIEQEAINKKQEFLDDLLLSALRKVEPPIKGKATQGKITWRGVQIFEQKTDGSETIHWIQQRDKIISKKFIINVVSSGATVRVEAKIWND